MADVFLADGALPQRSFPVSRLCCTRVFITFDKPIVDEGIVRRPIKPECLNKVGACVRCGAPQDLYPSLTSRL